MQGLLYANAAVSAHEVNMLSSDRVIRLADCETLADAVKVLMESGYAGGTILARPEDFPLLISKERELAAEFIKKVAPNNCGIECFFLEKDYLNTKAALKAKLFAAEIGFVSGGLYTEGAIEDAVGGGRGETLSPFLAEAIKTVLSAEAVTPAFVDVALDRAYYAETTARLKRAKAPLLTNYFKDLLDGRNALTFLRVRRAGLSIKKFGELFIHGGDIAFEAYKKIFDDDVASVAALLKGRSMYGVFSAEAADLVAVERGLDDVAMRLIAKSRYEMSTVGPMAFYYFGKEQELKTVNVILTALKNNVAKDVMKARLRQIYA